MNHPACNQASTSTGPARSTLLAPSLLISNLGARSQLCGGNAVSKVKRKRKPRVPAKLKIGYKARVKDGITDVEYQDMPMGGWAGTISELHNDAMYTVRRSRVTLASIHPIFKKQCERDAMVLEECWLSDDDLEPDAGGPLDVDHPTEIEAKPLSTKDQDDRIRMMFGLTSNDPLPDVDDGRSLTLEPVSGSLQSGFATRFAHFRFPSYRGIKSTWK